MPSGRTHDRITLWSLPAVAGVTLATTRSSSLTLIVCGGFLFGGLMFGPDLDIHSVQFKRWGWMRWIWVPYRGSLKHRSPLSHSPITGTALRIVYLLAWLGLAVFAGLALVNQVAQFGWTWDQIGSAMWQTTRQYGLELLTFCIGLELGALSHYVADWGMTQHKRFKKQGWKAFKPATVKPKRRTAKRRK